MGPARAATHRDHRRSSEILTLVIEIKDLSVERGGKLVLDQLSLVVAAGEVYALLGSNGAGKSTTLFALLGLTTVGSGTVRVAGKDSQTEADAVRAATAYLPENVALYDHLSARENVLYFLGLADQKRTWAEIEEAFASVRLEPAAWDRRLDAFSKGMRQKTAIALAMLRNSSVLLLDEPTSGLDPVASSDFHALLGELKARGVAVLMVTHDLLGAADSADVIGLIERGRIAREWRASAGAFDLRALHQAFAGRDTP
jgi:ABC-2 type transport system ATP-binding protein